MTFSQASLINIQRSKNFKLHYYLNYHHYVIGEEDRKQMFFGLSFYLVYCLLFRANENTRKYVSSSGYEIATTTAYISWLSPAGAWSKKTQNKLGERSIQQANAKRPQILRLLANNLIAYTCRTLPCVFLCSEKNVCGQFEKSRTHAQELRVSTRLSGGQWTTAAAAAEAI